MHNKLHIFKVCNIKKEKEKKEEEKDTQKCDGGGGIAVVQLQAKEGQRFLSCFKLPDL